MTLQDVAVFILASDSMLLFGGAIGLKNWSYISRPIKVLAIYMIFCAVVELSQFLIIRLGYSPNITTSLALIINIALIVYFYFLILELPDFKKTFIVSYIVVVIFLVFNLLFIQKSEMNSYSIVVRMLIALFLGLFYFYRLSLRAADTKLALSPLFWFNTGLVIQASGNLFLYLISDYFIHVLNNDMILFTGLNYIFHIFIYIMFISGIWLGVKEGRMKASESKLF